MRGRAAVHPRSGRAAGATIGPGGWPAHRRGGSRSPAGSCSRTGAAVVLDVEGPWWHEIGTGTLLCSRAAAEDPRAAQRVLRRAFESGLRRA